MFITIVTNITPVHTAIQHTVEFLFNIFPHKTFSSNYHKLVTAVLKFIHLRFPNIKHWHVLVPEETLTVGSSFFRICYTRVVHTMFCWSQGYTPHPSSGHNTSGSQSMDSGQIGGSMGRGGTLGRGSIASVGKPSSSTLASLAGLLSSGDSGTKAESSFSQAVSKREDRETDTTENSLAVDKEPVFQRVRVSL
jgi:hypothetical protein